ncbi:MAG: hypothetical protein A3H69_02130 [Candidatus Sungbacteria bacterium RIFCSPLOWO2_02_FULL_47_9]|uniref:TGS domain-containing protein n=1 Tax=Candidatus Sungbacteria bacterium RIFCSPHIGHO2_01_FULL_47_32 TaxID=1802264 RepID=A0A1G2K6Q0_9BACT|nr:MAG: (P)ppGpp synthetase I, SpoT/RelA [Parcubacteria group bacterium GW2011_GWA2_47_10]OGZ94251.1 MAG: hypothetical protein A2633_05565 [Candidatus Sungbacteria bacterium RIFCSPHIGHO2_01_FULL_47_32]OGZ99720.1 MAG: hypothetical protein A3D57_02355 [Candidatus Sungbacteria bacterium RIFCSPHIGHO2_02_FULL_46_12]OHA05892.1 MAG: hypothetical protein A3A28_02695 [Candidatus Sungbacteria bacterium RIFCSPLOWO2_01_FULL_47_32]OHA08610.1 MAG: hypothetical protein A3H69_02130 [Candidatus Sungbacteria bac
MTIEEIIKKAEVKLTLNDSDKERIMRAFEFAKAAHGVQKRKSGDLYIEHPLMVAYGVAEMGLDASAIVAALLHDVCEDTTCAPETLEKNFGKDVLFLVDGVTKLDKIRFHGTEREAENLRKMFLAIAEDIRVVLIKLMDRRHNMKTLSSLPPEKQKRIALETLELYAPLAYRLGIGEIKGQLEDLAFPYVYPKEHEWLIEQVKDPLVLRQKYAERLIPLVKKELEAENIHYRDVHGRGKHLFSLYKKLLKYEMDINKIFDLVAVRVVVGTIEECYGALGVVHKLWRPMPGLVKDYIALPKPNGYRSIHTTVFGPEGRVTEFQIRTEEMHIQAEQGIAAHWAYSESKSGNIYRERQTVFADKKQLEWVNQLRDWQKEFRNPDEFIESLKIDFFKNRIFVLTPKGDVIDLPEGATPVDFAYQVHTDIGNQAAGARVNAKMVPLDHELHNGDVIEVITQKNKKPSSDWLKFVKTAGAKKRIQVALRETREAIAFSRRGGQMVELRLAIKDRIGLLKDVSEIVADFKINMKSITSETKNRLYPLIVIHAPFKNKEQLEKMMVKMKNITGVEEVSYTFIN